MMPKNTLRIKDEDPSQEGRGTDGNYVTRAHGGENPAHLQPKALLGRPGVASPLWLVGLPSALASGLVLRNKALLPR